jgi:hypothetical protein
MDSNTTFTPDEVRSIAGSTITCLITAYKNIGGTPMAEIEGVIDSFIEQHALSQDITKRVAKAMTNSKWDHQGRPRVP